MVRPCVARGFVELAFSGLASMYPVSDWSCFAPDQYGYQRACDLINGQDYTGPCGSPVFARAGKTDPPSLLILSQTSAGEGIEYVLDSLLGLPCSFVRAWRPFLRPDLRVQRCAARRDRQGWPSRLPCLSRPVLPGHALTGPSTARGLSGSVRCFIGLDALEGAPLVKNRPGDAGELVGERNRQHVVVQSFLGGFDPRFEAIALPTLYLDQHNPRGLHEQNAQVAIASP